MPKTKELSTQVSQELIDAVRQNMPQEASFQRILLPRLNMFSQDQTEGKGKAMIVTSEAGTFYTESETDELNDAGKKIWKKDEIGPTISGTVAYYRKQLSMYDQATEKYTNSPIYDTDDEIIPLFCDKKEVARGTPKDLKAMYAFTDPKDNKKKSKLQDNKILYILYEGDTYQMALKGTSMYSFMTYTRSVIPPTVFTEFSSEAKQNGSTEWNMMTFKTLRQLTKDEMEEVLNLQFMIKASVKAEKDYYASMNTDVETTVSTPADDVVAELNGALPDGKQF